VHPSLSFQRCPTRVPHNPSRSLTFDQRFPGQERVNGRAQRDFDCNRAVMTCRDGRLDIFHVYIRRT
jgi:hypothetical protein